MNQPKTAFYFEPFNELGLSKDVPVMAIVFEDQHDLVIAQCFPEFELERSRLDNIGDKGDETVVFIPIYRNEMTYSGGIVYIDYPWRKTKTIDFSSMSFYRKVSAQIILMVKMLRNRGFTEVNILLPSRFHLENIKHSARKHQSFLFVKTITEAIVYANNSLDDFKSNRPAPISRVTFTYFGEYEKAINDFFQKAIGEGKDVGEALGYARRLIEMPPNLKTPLSFIQEALGVDLSHCNPNGKKGWVKITGHCFSSKIKVQFLYGTKTIRNFGLRLIAAVGQGSIHEPCFLKIHYKPRTTRKKKVRKITITGKGVLFDTGGIDLKLTGNYENMHYDMAGAANVVGLIKLAEEQNLKVEIIGLLPLVKNSIGSNAIEPFSVIKGYNGKTVEIKNTDAEGRLISADTIAYSEKNIRPELTISTATLCSTEDITAGILQVFATNKSLEKKTRIAETQSAEPIILWPSPEHLSKIDNDLSGNHTDLVNDLNYGHYSNGLMFIYNFFNNYPASWVYIDVGSIFMEDAVNWYAGPGFGLKFMWHLVKQFE